MKKKNIIFLFISLIIFFITFVIALMVGRYNISFKNFFMSVFSTDSIYSVERSIILYSRLPRTIMAGLTGIALCVSGLLYQETFQNNLVSPDLLGVSNGASVGAAFAIVIGLSSVMISLLSFILGIITVVATLLISKSFKNKSSLILILSGLIVSGFMQSLLSMIKYFANPETQLSSITYWLMGSFSDVTIKQVYILFPIVLVSIIFLLCICWRINIVALGKEEAQTKGINYVLYRTVIVLIATLLTATSVSFCGTISWIGLVIPQIVRLLVGRNTTKSLPLTITFGGIFMIIVDVLSRTFTSAEIPLSAITGLFGSIIFVAILVYNRRNLYEH